MNNYNVECYYPSDSNLHTLFEQQVARSPEAIALIDGQTQLNYAFLNNQANQLAYCLRERGVKIGSIVACHLEYASEVVLYTLAILKAGGTYLLLDPALPKHRILFLVENAEPVLIITDTIFVDDGSTASDTITPPVYTVDELSQAASTQKTENPLLLFDNESPAYLAYTSGSTGKPKGVLISHRSCVNHVYAFSNMFKLNPDDRIPLIASITFDVATEEMLPPLISGGTMVSSSPTYESMLDFNAEILKNKYTILNLPAPLWHTWTEYLARNELPIPESVRVVIVGSDKIYTKHYVEWSRLKGAERVLWVAAYGTTETAVTSSFYTTAHLDDLTDEPLIPIGKPIANTFLYVLDEDLQPVGMGEVGELYVGGHGVGLGYYKRPERTAEKFLPDPFCGEASGRMYRTGDLARYRLDGNFVCLGRKDHQIKINSLRFELGEIEATLIKHPAVQHAFVVMHQHDDDHEESKRLTAFIILKNSSVLKKEEVKLHLHNWSKEKLHRYVCPHAFLILLDVPLTSSGKIDRIHLAKIAIEYKEE